MSRLSWASSGSDAEVQHHFDQPFDYDHRHGWSQNEEQEEQNDSEHSGHEGKAHFDESADAVSLNESHNSSDVEPIHSQDPHPDTSTSRQDPLDDANDQSNQAICRICLDSSSSDASGGESLGRLLSPCRCKGTMKYVHATCLDQWRAASARSSSAVACDQCGAPYRFRKSKFVGLATSPTLLFIVSLFLFLLLIWTVGLVATFCMDLYDKPAPLKSTSRRADSLGGGRGRPPARIRRRDTHHCRQTHGLISTQITLLPGFGATVLSCTSPPLTSSSSRRLSGPSHRAKLWTR